MEIELLIQEGLRIQYPVVKDGIKWSVERKGSPGKLQFTVIKDEALNFQEGNAVRLTVDGVRIFYGFVFTKKRNKDKTIDVVAYDQLRYFKNKDTLLGFGMKASDILQRIAADFRLNLGDVTDTEYVIPQVVEENKTLFDMVQNGLDETLLNTGKLYVLFDDAGRLCLKNIKEMAVGLIVDAETGENYNYESSIDSQTFNRVKLVYEDEKSGRRVTFMTQNSQHMNDWGILQYYEEIRNPVGASAKADALLHYYDQKTRKLSIKNAMGDLRVRAGSSVMVSLNLGDIIANQFMMVNQVTHTFKDNSHFMDLDMIGGEFIG